MARGFTVAASNFLSTATAPISDNTKTLIYGGWALSTNNSTNMEMVYVTNSGTPSRYYRCGITSGNPFCQYSGAGSPNTIVSSTVWTVNTWHHLMAVCIPGTSLALYRDGVLDSSIAATAGDGTAMNVCYCGRDQVDGTFSNGNAAEYGLWNVALTITEIAALALGTRAYKIRATALVGYWPLDGLVSPEPDLSGNANSFILNAAPTSQFGPPFGPFTQRWPQHNPPPPAVPVSVTLMGACLF